MNLAHFSRRRYTVGATPLERLSHLTRALAGPEIWIKRDDLTGLTGGGNKTRKLEFLVADALAQNCDTLITAGAVQSNHCRLTLAAAVKEGLKCRLVLEQHEGISYNPRANGNAFLFDLLGVESVTVVPAGANLDAAMQQVASDLAKEGRKAYAIPVGGSDALGSLGYVACAMEIEDQAIDARLEFDHLICASGSAGTHAGLIAGFHGLHSDMDITGINVRRTRREQEEKVHTLVGEVAELLSVPEPPRSATLCRDEWVGPGYAMPTPEMVEAVRMLASLEGILLDPTYTGKAMAGLIGLVRQKQIRKDSRVLFLHTGGAPALYANHDVIREGVKSEKASA